VGLVLVITLFGFEGLGVLAAMPVIADELDGRALYGAAFSAFLVAQLVAAVAAGIAAERVAIHRVFTVGLAVFTLGIVVAGAAPTMPALVGARVVQGLGAGAITATAFVVVSRAWDASRRPTMLAWLSAGWVVPALVAPAVTGAVAEHLSWRLVFFGVLPLVPVAAALAIPPMRTLPLPTPPAGADAGAQSERVRRRMVAALALAGGIAAAQAGAGLPPAAGAIVVVVALAAVVRALHVLMPVGTLTAGTAVGAAIAVKVLGGIGFFGTEAFVPLALTEVHGLSATVAGLALTSSSVLWTLGSFMAARRSGVWSDTAIARAGGGLLLLGLAVLVWVLDPDLPVALAFVGVGVAGIGIGLVFNTANAAALACAPEEGIGVEDTSVGLNLADALAGAIGTGFGGAVLAGAERAGWEVGGAVGIVWATMAGVIVVGLVAAGRMVTPVRVPIAARAPAVDAPTS